MTTFRDDTSRARRAGLFSSVRDTAQGPGLIAAAITVLLWSSAFAGIRAGLRSYAPASVALLRYLTASVVLGAYALLGRIPLPERRDLPGIALTGFLGLSVYNVALNAGEVDVPAGVASFIVASSPVYMAIMASAFFGERLTAWGWVGIAVSLLGVAIIGLVKDREIQLEPRALLVLLAALAQSLYFVWQKPYLKKYGAFNYATYTVLAGTFFLLVFTPGLLRDVGGATRQATWAVIYMGVFPGAIGYASWSFVLSRMPASVAGSFLYLVPAVAAFIAWVWLGEVLTLIALFGGALVIGGVLLVNLLGKRQG